MKRRTLTLGVALALVVFAPVVPARAQEKPAPAASPGDTDVAAELQKLDAEFKAAQTEYYRPLREAKDRSQGVALDPAKHPARTFLTRYRTLADRAKGTKAGLDATVWIVSSAPSFGEDGKAASMAAIEALGTTYLDSPALEPTLGRLGYASRVVGAKPVEDLLTKVAEKSPHARVQAAASYALGELEDKILRHEKEARDAYQRTVDRFGDTPYAERARARLAVLGKLEVGKVAPDFEAVDQDGVTWKLSEYRGKVVVLDFWGFW